MRRGAHLGVAVAAVAALTVLAGCAQSPLADDSFRERIPAAIEAAGIGVSEPWADEGVDGFNSYLSVGGTVASGEITDDDLRRLVAISVEENTIDVRYLEVSLRDDARKSVDIVPGLERLGADVIGDDRITFADAEAIAGGSER